MKYFLSRGFGALCLGFGLLLCVIFVSCGDEDPLDKAIKPYEQVLNENLKSFQAGFRQSKYQGDIFLNDFTCKKDEQSILCTSKSPVITQPNGSEIITAKHIIVRTNMLYLDSQTPFASLLTAHESMVQSGAKYYEITVKDMALSPRLAALMALASISAKDKDEAYLLSLINDKYDYKFSAQISKQNDIEFDISASLINTDKNIKLSTEFNVNLSKDFYSILEQNDVKYDTIANQIIFKPNNQINGEEIFKTIFAKSMQISLAAGDPDRLINIINRYKNDAFALSKNDIEIKFINALIDEFMRSKKLDFTMIFDKNLSLFDLFSNNHISDNSKLKLNNKTIDINY